MDEKYISALLACLKTHLKSHPEASEKDIEKFIFQGMLGVGHLLGDRDAVVKRILDEVSDLAADAEEPLTELLSPAWCRLNLRRAMAEGLSAEVIGRMMLAPADVPAFTRIEVYDVCRAQVENASPRMLDPQWLPEHSERYRACYHPAYRVIPADWMPCMEAICRIFREKTGRCLATIDGPCASGKTTLAAKLAELFDAAVLHTDDFVVPHRYKTPDRLAIPGGNCDWERLTEETLIPWKNGGPLRSRRYAFREDRMLDWETAENDDMLILEGSYCNLPAIRALADLRIYMDTPWEERKKRLEKRESPQSLMGFYTRWIPLENAYFTAYSLPDAGCIVIRGNGRKAY